MRAVLYTRKIIQAATATTLALGIAGCAPVLLRQDNAQAQYAASISDAAVASPQKIVKLLPIPPDSTIKVVSWVNERRLPCGTDQIPCDLQVGQDRLWVTLAGEVQQRCRAWGLSGDALRARLEQLLGLPPDSPPQYRKVKFVVMEVAHDKIDRPCLGVDLSDPAQPVCSVTAPSNQAAGAELRNFVGRQMAASYFVNVENRTGYPFTRLGYTYDWHPEAAQGQHYGASEFVVAPDTKVKVLDQIATDAYCSRASDK